MYFYQTLLTYHRCSKEATGQVFTVGSIEALEAYTPGQAQQNINHCLIVFLQYFVGRILTWLNSAITEVGTQ